MFGDRIVLKRGNKDEGEKPFWISFSDLMTALMVLFLVVMGVALLAVTKNVTEQEKKAAKHEQDKREFLHRLVERAKEFPGVNVNEDIDKPTVDFGEQARFSNNDDKLTPAQEDLVRAFIPVMLNYAKDELGRSTLRRYVVEGYTSKSGTYLHNLNLSMKRAQRLLCTMLATNGNHLLSNLQKEQVRDLFMAGGYSFNSVKQTDDESRRVEIRLEFTDLNDLPRVSVAQTGVVDFGKCEI